MRISPYYLKWMIAVACVSVASFVIAANIDTPEDVNSWLLKPFIVMIQTSPLWHVVLTTIVTSIVIGLAYGWLFRQIYHGLRRRVRQRR